MVRVNRCYHRRQASNDSMVKKKRLGELCGRATVVLCTTENISIVKIAILLGLGPYVVNHLFDKEIAFGFTEGALNELKRKISGR